MARADIVVRRRAMRRHRTAVTAAAATILVALLALAITYRREVAANRQLRLAKAESDRRLDQTLEAIQDYYTGVGEEVLLGRRNSSRYERSCWQSHASSYERMTRELESAKANDEHGRFVLARGRLGLGKILFALGRYAEAERAVAQGHRPLRFAGQKSAQVVCLPEALASCHNNLGGACGSRGKPRRRHRGVSSSNQADRGVRKAGRPF